VAEGDPSSSKVLFRLIHWLDWKRSFVETISFVLLGPPLFWHDTRNLCFPHVLPVSKAMSFFWIKVLDLLAVQMALTAAASEPGPHRTRSLTATILEELEAQNAELMEENERLFAKLEAEAKQKTR
jgi:hypothetical protein